MLLRFIFKGLVFCIVWLHYAIYSEGTIPDLLVVCFFCFFVLQGEKPYTITDTHSYSNQAHTRQYNFFAALVCGSRRGGAGRGMRGRV